MKKLALVAVLALLIAGNAFAMPVIDGINTAGEWTTGLYLNAFDLNEAIIPDTHDFSRIAMFQETGGVGNGLYILVELYGSPTFAAASVVTTGVVVYGIKLDLNLDGDFTDAIDRSLDYRSTGLTIKDGTGSAVLGAPASTMGSVVEFYIPSGMFSAFPTGGFNTFAFLDNGGSPDDDFIPDSGYITTTPEPASAALLGFGLIGFVGSMFRRKFRA